MKKEETLSDKIFTSKYMSGDFLLVYDVKEFIKKLKEGLPFFYCDIIDKLAGEKLLHSPERKNQNENPNRKRN